MAYGNPMNFESPMASVYNPVGVSGQRMFPRGGQGGFNPRTLPNIGGSALKNIMGGMSGKMPGGLGNFGGGTGGALGSIGSIAGGGLMAGQGINQLLHSKSGWGDIGGGMETGAGIGSMIMPGLGTLIGGGLGALGGGIKALFRIGKPSPEELEGRTAQNQGAGMFSQFATPQERAEAQQGVSSGAWKNIDDPLQIIVTRNRLIQSGMDSAKADQQAQAMKHSTWDAEKGGAPAVQQAFSQYAPYFRGR